MPRSRVQVSGTVQGVGFRPFVSRLAARMGLTGAIRNNPGGVSIEVQGPAAELDAFIDALVRDAPPLAEPELVGWVQIETEEDEAAFVIVPSDTGAAKRTAGVPPDIAPCEACRAEIADPLDRRGEYAFTCCTDCGPRYTVVQRLPYDRGRTSMAPFALCDDCAQEYADPADRRFHAQATCCPACGPALELRSPEGDIHDDIVFAAAGLLRRGRILALKGVGGYQLVCRADDQDAVTRLRERKNRDEKPFALLVASLAVARDLVELDAAAATALSGPEAPIVLAQRCNGTSVAEAVAPDTKLLGVMLPATPLHALLAAALGDEVPLVCTSGNRSDEPIVIDDTSVERDLGDIADAILTHDRRIERRADDSVGRVVGGEFQLLRRARGFAPRPVGLLSSGPTVLAVGAELKSTVCLAVDADAHVSVHLGDLEHAAALAAFEGAVADILAVTGTSPDLVVHDLHPEYLSTKFALAAELAPTLAVQHHHAHLVSCLSDNGRSGRAIGVTFDGLGWGDDETLWGGEFLVGDAGGFDRAAHLLPVPLPGGSAAIREPWRMAVSWLAHSFGAELPDAEMVGRHEAAVPSVLAQCVSGRSAVTSSVGRLFDAVAALCGLGDSVTYEGQPAVRLEQAAGDTCARYAVALSDGQPIQVDPSPLIRSIIGDLAAGADAAVIAGGFHRWVADMTVAVSRAIRTRTGCSVAALSGGVFQNKLLVELAAPMLVEAGFDVVIHRRVPPNDGGISLGQVVIGRAWLSANGYR